LNQERISKASQTEKKDSVSQPVQAQRQYMAHDALDVLTNFCCGQGTTMNFDDFDLSQLKGNLQGYNLGLYVIAWAQTLTWPPADGQGLLERDVMVAHWGISWFELYINFVIMTQKFCPVRISGSLGDTIFAGFKPEEACLLPTNERSGMVQCTSFQSAVRCVESVLRTKLFPEHVQKGGSSLHRFGFQGQIAGLFFRPVMKQQPLTVTTVFDYITEQSNKRKLRSIVQDIPIQPQIILQEQCEPSAKERFLEYKRIYGRRRYT
jgi:hypothetical protein